MLAVLRVILMALAILLIFIASFILCILRPFHRDNVHYTAKMLGVVARFLGLTVEVRVPEEIRKLGPVVYICNHQNSYDIFTISGAVLPGTVSIGKKSLKWIPFFGWMYWLTGNILIDRKNKSKAHGTINKAADIIADKKLSVWLFPEGTRSRGRGLLPFKTGAFRTAQQANVPIVPIVATNICNTIDLNRWDNGKMIIEYLPPIPVEEIEKQGLREFANNTHAMMADKIVRLNAEAGVELVKAAE